MEMKHHKDDKEISDRKSHRALTIDHILYVYIHIYKLLGNESKDEGYKVEKFLRSHVFPIGSLLLYYLDDTRHSFLRGLIFNHTDIPCSHVAGTGVINQSALFSLVLGLLLPIQS